MKCIVPLAGPDLWTEKYGLRPLFEYKGDPLIKSALMSRSWASEFGSQDYVFVIRDIAQAPILVSALRSIWPDCGIVSLSHLTAGGMMSALAGISLLNSTDPVVVDLADILIFDQLSAFNFSDETGAIVPVFDSEDPVYSYLEELDGHVVRAAEKRVISNNASAGVYVFSKPSVFISSAAYCLQNASDVTYRGNFFVCPMVNGVLAAGQTVLAPRVHDVVPVGKLFH